MSDKLLEILENGNWNDLTNRKVKIKETGDVGKIVGIYIGISDKYSEFESKTYELSIEFDIGYNFYKLHELELLDKEVEDIEKLQETLNLLCRVVDKLDLLGSMKYVGDDMTDAMINLLELSDYQLDPDDYLK